MFGVVVEGGFAEFAADAGHLVTAEGGGGVEDVVAVDPDGAGAEFVGDLVGFGDVFGPDGGGEAVEALVARSTTSSASENGRMLITGPKISSVAMGMSSLT